LQHAPFLCLQAHPQTPQNGDHPWRCWQCRQSLGQSFPALMQRQAKQQKARVAMRVTIKLLYLVRGKRYLTLAQQLIDLRCCQPG
jgi:hypothetical protein